MALSRLIKFIKKRPYLLWGVSDLDNVSEELIVESVLNHGDFKDFKELTKIIEIKEISAIFKRQTREKRCNYKPEIKNYFLLYFKKHA